MMQYLVKKGASWCIIGQGASASHYRPVILSESVCVICHLELVPYLLE